MYSKGLSNYECPFCKIVKGQPDDIGQDRSQEVVYTDEESTAFIASHWWPDVEGVVLIVPNIHFENVFDLPDEILAKISVLSKKLARAMKEAYGCEGVSFRQHNIAGNQSVFHYHLQVLPRRDGDNLYQNQNKKFLSDSKKRKEYADKIKSKL